MRSSALSSYPAIERRAKREQCSVPLLGTCVCFPFKHLRACTIFSNPCIVCLRRAEPSNKRELSLPDTPLCLTACYLIGYCAARFMRPCRCLCCTTGDHPALVHSRRPQQHRPPVHCQHHLPPQPQQVRSCRPQQAGYFLWIWPDWLHSIQLGDISAHLGRCPMVFWILLECHFSYQAFPSGWPLSTNYKAHHFGALNT